MMQEQNDLNEMLRKISSGTARNRDCVLALIGFWLVFFPLFALGAGIAVMEQSVKELGHAFSGAPVNTEDASMVFFNPAAMSQVRGRMLSMAGYVIAPSSTFHDQASQLSPLVGGAPLVGHHGGDSAKIAFIPNVYYVHELTDRVAIGIGFNTPFGMKNGYASDWQGRYQALDSEIITLNFNPSVSYKITEKFSVGAGFNVQYLHTRLTNAIDFGTICVLQAGDGSCASRGLSPQAADGHFALKGDSVGFGYNVGALYSFNGNDTRLGVSYRSRVSHDIHGHGNFSVPAHAGLLIQRVSGQFIDTGARMSATLPDTVLFGFSHRINPRWMVSADALWTHWSLIRELRTDFSSAQRDDVLDLKWRDTWRYAAGISYFSDSGKWTIRTGFAFDQTPIPNAQHRSPRIPDASRYWLTVGLSYAVFKNVHLHAAYAHLFMSDAGIDHRGPTGDRLTGYYNEQINIGGLQMDWRF